MSKFDEIVKCLKSKEVRYRKIKDICSVTRGRVISKTDLIENFGEYPVYSSQTLNGGVFGTINTFDFDGEYIQWTTDGANAGSVFYRNGKFSVTNVCGLLKVKEEVKDVNPKYLAYILEVTAKKYVNYATSNPKLMSNVVEKIEVAVPPLEVQCEIVHILDDFTLLSAELSAELKAREEQYQYYCDKLFTNKNYEMKKIGDICSLERGGNFQKKDFADCGVPCIHYGQIYTHYGVFTDKTIKFLDESIAKKQKIAKKNDIIMAVTSENVSDVCKAVAWLGNDDVAVSGHSVIIKHSQNAKYLSYLFRSSIFQKQKEKYAIGVKVIEVKPSNLAKIEIPIPPLEEQERIVKILDKFNKITNDIVEGIPAEIETRQIQYEYYRNKLLSFK